MQTILFIHTGGSVEVFLSLSALRAVRARFPSAYIAVAAGQTQGDVFRLASDADEIISLGRNNIFLPTRHYSFLGLLRAANQLRKRTFDAVIDLHSSVEDGVLAFISGAKVRTGRATGLGRKLSSLFAPNSSASSVGRHLSDCCLDAIASLGVTNPNDEFRLDVSSSALATIDKHLQKAGWRTGEPLVILHQSAVASALNVWTEENFAALGVRLVNEFGVRLVLFETVEDNQRNGRIASLLRSGLKRPPTFLRRLSFHEVLALAARSSLVIGQNHLPVHLGAAVGAPVLALMNAGADSSIAAVRGLRHKLIYTSSLRPASIEEVFNIACEILQSSRLGAIFDA